MLHEMRLKEEPFCKIWEGKKTIELRLYDEKRRLLQIGDEILFTPLSGGAERIRVRVVKLHLFDSFQALYEALPLEQCGYDVTTMATAKASDMDAYYSPEEQARYGVVGIEMQVTHRE